MRASRANFALIWVQGKGVGAPHYARWTMQSARLWPTFAEELRDVTGLDVALKQTGAFTFASPSVSLKCLPKTLRQSRANLAMTPRNTSCSTIGKRPECCRHSGDVIGSIYSPMDGDVNSLRLFRALHIGMIKLGAGYQPHCEVSSITPRGGGFLLSGLWGEVFTERVILAAGNGNAELAESVGLKAPVLRSKGQILVTEKCAPFFPTPRPRCGKRMKAV